MNNNKTLLIKAPSTIDADLLAVDEMRVTLRTPANYGGTTGANAIGLSEKGTFKVLSGNSTLRITNNGKDFSPVNGTNETDISIVSLKDYTKLLRLGQSGDYSIIGFKTFYADSNIDILEDCPSLTSLSIDSSNVTGDIGKLSTLTGLTWLSIDNSNVTGDIGKLSTLTRLTKLSINSSNVTGDISKLSTLTGLIYLIINSSNITGDIGKLSTLTGLTSLSINSSNVIGDIGKLSTLTRLTRLKLYDGNISGSFSSIVNLMPNLAGEIYLTKGVTYTDADLAIIKSRGGNIITGTKV